MITYSKFICCRSRRPCGPRCSCAVTRLLGPRVRIQARVWKF